MKIEQISYDEIREGDYIVRIAKSSHDQSFFTTSGHAHFKDSLPFPIYGNITREYWMTEMKTTLAMQDSEAGEPLPNFPEGYENYFRVTH